MYFTGFADEASRDFSGQIDATLKLGWKNIEARGINGTNIHDISDDEFDAVAERTEQAGVRINCFGSAVANWAHSITEPCEVTEQQLQRAIPRMQRLGTKLIRIMSYAVLPDREPDDQMEDERFRRVRIITQRLLDAGIQPVHENCMNYGGMGWKYTLKLLDNVPGLKLVYDTGNPVFTADRCAEKPYPQQSSWEFYSHVKHAVAYVHIKDGVWSADQNKTRFTFPGEGDGDVIRIMTDLIKSGYDGGISIEPHMVCVAHEPSEADREAMFTNYVEYGQRIMKIVEDITTA